MDTWEVERGIRTKLRAPPRNPCNGGGCEGRLMRGLGALVTIVVPIDPSYCIHYPILPPLLSHYRKESLTNQ